MNMHVVHYYFVAACACSVWAVVYAQADRKIDAGVCAQAAIYCLAEGIKELGVALEVRQ